MNTLKNIVQRPAIFNNKQHRIPLVFHNDCDGFFFLFSCIDASEQRVHLIVQEAVSLNSIMQQIWLAFVILVCSEYGSSFSVGYGFNDIMSLRVDKHTNRDLLVMMATKKAKKKKDAASASIAASNTAATPEVRKPMRVDNNINVPVRQQIAWAKAYKRIMSSSFSNSNQITKKFRGDRGPKEVRIRLSGFLHSGSVQ
jgi:hypothetical protein